MDRARLMRIGRDQLSAWLPVLLMMLFALGTWWLMRSAPRIIESSVERPVSKEPDYYMRDFSVRTFKPDGKLKSELKGAEGRHFPVDDSLEVTLPRMRSYDEDGHPTLASAKRGVSNADVSEVQLFGDAHVVRDAVTKPGGSVIPRMEFRGEYLHAFIDEDRVSSDRPVELIRGPDVFTGDVFDYDDRSGVANLRGRVRGVIQPGGRKTNP